MVSETTHARKLTLRQSLQRNFIAGLFLLLPLVVSIFILAWLYSTITDPTVQILKQVFPELQTSGWAPWLSVFALSFTLGLVVGAGFCTRHVLGRKMFQLLERMVLQVPVLNKVYAGSKQIIEGFSPDKKSGFERVVLVEFPRAGSYAVGFVTGEDRGILAMEGKKGMLTVFVPTTPNPTSGFLLVVASEQVKNLDVSVAEGIKLVISGGTAIPERRRPPGTEETAHE
ncbi:MAG: DUF502 domain-containing protein [Verrucomicrobiae bacterium]|nr:DUF502 domain-containing protein [Verrucomicrobiae bacterium]